jgi:hypothetical protein
MSQSRIRTTHTCAELAVSQGTYDEVRGLLANAGYEHAFNGPAIDMHGIALVPGGVNPQTESRIASALNDATDALAASEAARLAAERERDDEFRIASGYHSRWQREVAAWEALEEAAREAINAIDEELGDSESAEDDRPLLLAMQGLVAALSSPTGETPQTNEVQDVR